VRLGPERAGGAERAGLVEVVQDGGQAARAILRFGDLIRATPSLRAYQADMMDQFVSVVTQVLAARAGMSPDEPEPQIAARALLGLWHVQANSLRTHLDGARAPARVRDVVTADVRRAARLLENRAALVRGARVSRRLDSARCRRCGTCLRGHIDA
jgi:MftR C-terminal domain